MNSEYISYCLLCGPNNAGQKNYLTNVIDFGQTPLANEFSDYGDLIIDDEFPLQLKMCNECSNFQISHIINPERLFLDYLYVSGTSSSTQAYAKKYAQSVVDKLSLPTRSAILDIGSNDGTYLKYFKELGMVVRGVDPAREIANKATINHLITTPTFFNSEYVKNRLEEGYKFNLIISNNCFAHIKDLGEVVRGVFNLLDSDGVFVFENSYIIDIIEKNLWDTIYHEHIFSHSLKPIIKFLNKFGMKVFDVERTSNQGGSIRVFCATKTSKYKVSENVLKLLEKEQSLPFSISNFENNCNSSSEKIRKKLNILFDDNKHIDIFGYPAKTTTLLYKIGKTNKNFRYAYDDAEFKQGKYSPGKHIPILHPDKLLENNPDYLFVGAWNFATSIIERCKKSGYKGKFIVPLPELEVIE